MSEAPITREGTRVVCELRTRAHWNRWRRVLRALERGDIRLADEIFSGLVRLGEEQRRAQAADKGSPK